MATDKDKQTQLLYGFSKNTEITEKKVDIEEALTRTKKPVVGVDLTFEVYGCYALPESWKSKIVSYNNYNHFHIFLSKRVTHPRILTSMKSNSPVSQWPTER